MILNNFCVEKMGNLQIIRIPDPSDEIYYSNTACELYSFTALGRVCPLRPRHPR